MSPKLPERWKSVSCLAPLAAQGYVMLRLRRALTAAAVLVSYRKANKKDFTKRNVLWFRYDK